MENIKKLRSKFPDLIEIDNEITLKFEDTDINDLNKSINDIINEFENLNIEVSVKIKLESIIYGVKVYFKPVLKITFDSEYKYRVFEILNIID